MEASSDPKNSKHFLIKWNSTSNINAIHTLTKWNGRTIESHNCKNNLEPRYRVEALMTAMYLKAKSPHKTIEKTTLKELWNGRKPTVKQL